MKNHFVKLIAMRIVLVVAAVSMLPSAGFPAEDTSAKQPTAENAPAYSIFYSPPERLDALFWAIVDSYAVENLEEAKAEFVKKAWEEEEFYDPYKLAGTPFWPEEEKLTALEGAFGGMPEYWQARYFFCTEGYVWDRLPLLEKMLELAPDDAATLYLYADRFMSISRDREESSLAEREGRAITREEFTDARLRAVDLIVRAAEREPSNAFYYYEAANLLGETGDYERVTELIKQGNVAPANEVVDFFPLSYIKRNFREIRGADDGSGKFRLLAFALITSPLPNYITRRDVIKNYQVILNMTGDIDLLNTLHVYTCRMGQAKYASTIHLLVAVVLNGIVEASAGEIGAVGTDPETLRAYSSMAGRRGSVRGIAFGLQSWGDFIRDEGLIPSLNTAGSEEVTPEEEWDAYLVWWEYQIMEVDYAGPAMATQLKMLEAYRYHEDGTITRIPWAEAHPEQIPSTDSAAPTE